MSLIYKKGKSMNVKCIITGAGNSLENLNTTVPQKLNYNLMRKRAMLNVLGQSNKDYVILQNSQTTKNVKAEACDIEAAKKFFGNTFSVLKDFLKA